MEETQQKKKKKNSLLLESGQGLLEGRDPERVAFHPPVPVGKEGWSAPVHERARSHRDSNKPVSDGENRV